MTTTIYYPNGKVDHFDSRTAPKFDENFWRARHSEREWHDCKYCYKEVPTFVLVEGLIGNLAPVQYMRVCWECGAGLHIFDGYDDLPDEVKAQIEEQH